MTRWREFEQLTGQILQELSPDAAVTVDDHIMGQESEGSRQIDVSIRKQIDGHEVLVIVQARNRSTPANINAVGEFASVVRDVGASKGILVCRAGFTRRAKLYAQRLGIWVINIHDAESRDWRQDIRIPVLWVDLTPTVQMSFGARFEGGDSVSVDKRRGTSFVA